MNSRELERLVVLQRVESRRRSQSRQKAEGAGLLWVGVALQSNGSAHCESKVEKVLMIDRSARAS